MKKIIQFLEQNGIEYRWENYGNPYYYNDGFSVPGLIVSFDYELTEDRAALEKKERLFSQYMKRRKAYCVAHSGRCGICIPWYTVMSFFDYRRYTEHEDRIKSDVEKFWQEEHARQMAEKLAAAI
ncbi:MAG: hypothetical protein NC548_30305 [Lachnospiraceae bacterium]|nr:hypothetical protein [Lachnospiraceae bacterium]